MTEGSIYINEVSDLSEKLTEKQKEILNFLDMEIREKGYPPSVREICQAVGLRSTSTVHGYLERLEKKGFIKKDATKTRALKVLTNEHVSGHQEAGRNYLRELVEVPIVGKVTAGAPILAVENIEGTFPMPVEYTHNSDVFALRVKGESMIEAGILDGDLVMVKKQSYASNRDIVVALLEDEATVKTYYKEKNAIRLQPENSSMSPIFSRDVKILGKVIGLFRTI